MCEWKHARKKQAHPVGSPVDGREVDVVLLDDGGVERVEVHDEDVAIPKTLGGLKDESSGELLLGDSDLGQLLAGRLGLGLGRLVLGGDLSLLLPRRDLVGADVVVLVEAMEENVLVSLGTVTAERLVPASKSGQRAPSSRRTRMTYQEFPARLVSCLVSGRACTLCAMAIWK